MPDRLSAGHWKIQSRSAKGATFFNVPVVSRPLDILGPQKLNKYNEPLDRVEARGVGFSEMQSYWALPFHDFAVAGDVCVVKDDHNRQLYDRIHICTANPIWLYSMKPLDSEFQVSKCLNF